MFNRKMILGTALILLLGVSAFGGGYWYAEATLPTADGTWGQWWRDAYVWVSTALHLDSGTAGRLLYLNSGKNVTSTGIGVGSGNDLTGVDDMNATDVFTSNLYANSAQLYTKLTMGTSGEEYSTDSMLILTRDIDSTGVGNAHGFSDSSNLTRSGIGYNSYDARIVITGTNNFNHYAGFQANPTYNCSGTIGDLYGFYANPTTLFGAVTRLTGLHIQSTLTGGATTYSYGIHVNDPTGAGTLTNNYGIRIESLIKGTTLNYAIYTAGTTPSYFGGAIQTDGKLAIGKGLTVADKNLEISTANGVEAALRIRQLTKNYWDFSIPASQTYLSISDAGGEKLRLDGLTEVSHSATLNDDVNVTIITGKAGWATILIGNNQEFAIARWTSGGTVTLVSNSTNVVTTDTDGKLCIIDSGPGVIIKNRLGSNLILRYDAYYS